MQYFACVSELHDVKTGLLIRAKTYSLGVALIDIYQIRPWPCDHA